jgi:hypothetical protein
LEELEEVIKMDPGISKAEERLRFVTQDKDFLRQYHIRQMELSDWTTGVNTAFEKARETLFRGRGRYFKTRMSPQKASAPGQKARETLF